MSLVDEMPDPRDRSFPRVSGDEPGVHFGVPFEWPFSPRERG